MADENSLLKKLYPFIKNEYHYKDLAYTYYRLAEQSPDAQEIIENSPLDKRFGGFLKSKGLVQFPADIFVNKLNIYPLLKDAIAKTAAAVDGDEELEQTWREALSSDGDAAEKFIAVINAISGSNMTDDIANADSDSNVIDNNVELNTESSEINVNSAKLSNVTSENAEQTINTTQNASISNYSGPANSFNNSLTVTSEEGNTTINKVENVNNVTASGDTVVVSNISVPKDDPTTEENEAKLAVTVSGKTVTISDTAAETIVVNEIAGSEDPQIINISDVEATSITVPANSIVTLTNVTINNQAAENTTFQVSEELTLNNVNIFDTAIGG